MKVYYFPIHGRAEQIRMVLTHVSAPFTDVKLTGAEFQQLK